MRFQKRTWLLVLFFLALVGAIAFQIIHISQTEKSYPMSMLQKGYETKTENLYPVKFQMSVVRSGYAYVNQSAQLVIEPQFDEAGKFSEGFAPVKVKDKWGFINLKGQISISPQYDMVGESFSPHDKKPEGDYYNDYSSSFSEGLAGVKLKGKWGFINQTGKLVIPYKFDKVQKFSGGVATVRVGDLWIELIEKFTEFHPKDGWGWGAKALSLDELGNDEEALIAWEKNIKLDPSDRSKWRSQMKESTLERLRSLNKL